MGSVQIHKSGYLREDIHYFALDNLEKKTFAFHYHDFHKIMLFLSGDVSYYLEQEQFLLEPMDLLLIHAGTVHKPVIGDSSSYHRIILYVSPSHIDSLPAALKSLFHGEDSRNYRLIRGEDPLYSTICSQLVDHELLFPDHKELDSFSLETCFHRFLLDLYRYLQGSAVKTVDSISDPLIADAIQYMNTHFREDIGIQEIAGALYVTSSHLMHRFKKITGNTIGYYLSEKRLSMTRMLISRGESVTQAALEGGFRNYQAYYHALKKQQAGSTSMDHV